MVPFLLGLLGRDGHALAVRAEHEAAELQRLPQALYNERAIFLTGVHLRTRHMGQPTAASSEQPGVPNAAEALRAWLV